MTQQKIAVFREDRLGQRTLEGFMEADVEEVGMSHSPAAGPIVTRRVHVVRYIGQTYLCTKRSYGIPSEASPMDPAPVHVMESITLSASCPRDPDYILPDDSIVFY